MATDPNGGGVVDVFDLSAEESSSCMAFVVACLRKLPCLRCHSLNIFWGEKQQHVDHPHVSVLHQLVVVEKMAMLNSCFLNEKKGVVQCVQQQLLLADMP